MFRLVLLVGVGGFFGSIARFGVSYAVNRHWSNAFPLGTFLINVVGCFIIGLLFGVAHRLSALQSTWWLMLATGFCGGFTTFSAFALENNNLMRGSQNTTALLYTLLSVVAGILICKLGIWMTS